MVAIDCPWCRAEAPIDPDLLAAAGGRYTCPECLTSVDLVAESREETLPLAA